MSAREGGDPVKQDEIARPSRAEIETLCLLDVVGQGEATLGDLTERLGLARELWQAVEWAILPLVARGHLEVREERVSLAEGGRAWLEHRLAELGVRSG
jgi:hypothetical protein